MNHFVKGLALGFSIAAPVGPIGLLCIRRSLTDGRLAGFISGLGAATADALYGAVAALGLTAVTTLLITHRLPIQLAGGLFLVWLGVRMMRAQPPSAAASAPEHTSNLFAAYVSTLGLTLANPSTILSFLGIFAGFDLGATAGDAWPACWLVLGVFLGSAAWWLILSTIASWLGARLDHGGLRTLNVASGLGIAAFGVWQLAQLASTR